MAQKKTKKNASDNQKIGIGIGLTAAAVSAAGAYFMYGSKRASQNRKKVKGWALKAKGEILEALEKAETITEEEYGELVESAVGAYGTIKSATAGEVKDFKREMGDHWGKLQGSKVIKKISAVTKKKVKKVVRRATKKTAKKAAKKTAKKVVKKTAKRATKKTTKKRATKKK